MATSEIFQHNRYRLLLLLLVLSILPILGCGEEVIVERKPAPDFTLKLFDGGAFNMADHKGKAVVVNFFASWCIPCKAEAPLLEKIYQEFNIKQVDPAKKVILVGIAVQDTVEAAKGFVKDTGITFPTGLDADKTIKEVFGVYGLPTTFFINGKGMINFTFAGEMTEELLIDELDKIRF